MYHQGRDVLARNPVGIQEESGNQIDKEVDQKQEVFLVHIWEVGHVLGNLIEALEDAVATNLVLVVSL